MFLRYNFYAIITLFEFYIIRIKYLCLYMFVLTIPNENGTKFPCQPVQESFSCSE